MSIRNDELLWYRSHGHYPNIRITKNSEGSIYVIGDFSWNKNNPQKQEFIEPYMASDLPLNKCITSDTN